MASTGSKNDNSVSWLGGRPNKVRKALKRDLIKILQIYTKSQQTNPVIIGFRPDYTEIAS